MAHHIGAQQPEQVGSHRAARPVDGAGLRPAGRAGAAGRRALVDDRPGGASGGLGGERYLQGWPWAPAALPYRALHAYSSAVSQTRPITVISLLALALNTVLNLPIYGKFVFRRRRRGLATGVVFWFSLICLAGWTRWRQLLPLCAVVGLELAAVAAATRAAETGRAGIAPSYFVAVTALCISGGAADRQSGAQVASHQVVINFTSLLYMIPQSLGVALSVLVGPVYAGGFARARFNSRIGLRLGAAIALCLSLLVDLRAPIVALYSADANVIEQP